MNTKKILIGSAVALAVGAVAYNRYNFYVTEGKKLFDYGWELSGVKVTRSSKGVVGLDVDATLTNPSAIGAEITDMLIKIYVGGVFIGTVTDIEPFYVEPNGSYTMPIHLDIDVADLKSHAVSLSIALLKGKDLPMKFEGYARIKHGIIPFKVPFSYNTTIKEYFYS